MLLEKTTCVPDLLQPLKLLQESIKPEAFFDEWGTYKIERWHIELSNLLKTASRLSPGAPFRSELEKTMVGTLILELAMSLKEISPWKDNWPEKFEELECYYIPYIEPVKCMLHADFLVNVSSSADVECKHPRCERKCSPQDSFSWFRTLSGHYVNLGSKGLATEQQIRRVPEEYEDAFFCRKCVIANLGINPGDRVVRNEENWMYADHDGGKGNLGFVSAVCDGDSIGYVDVQWDVKPEVVHRYCYGSGDYYDVKRLDFPKRQKVSIIRDTGEAEARYESFKSIIFETKQESVKISERQWAMVSCLISSLSKHFLDFDILNLLSLADGQRDWIDCGFTTTTRESAHSPGPI